MPRKKTTTTVPEDQTEQMEQTFPAETGEMEGQDLTPEGGAEGFPPGEDPYPDGGDGGSGWPNDDTPAAGDAESQYQSPEGPTEGEPFAAEDGAPKGEPDGFSGEGEAAGEAPAPYEGDGAADPEYDALLHEWSGTEGAHAPADNGGEEPLILDPPPGETAGTFAEPGASDAPSPEAEPDTPGPFNDTVSAQSAARPRRRTPASQAPANSRRDPDRERVLTIEARDEVQTEEERQAAIWHEIQNADWTRRILTGTLDGVEDTPSGITVAVVSYKGFRVAIPLKEMLIHTGPFPTGAEYRDLMERLRRILMTRVGCEIDFTIKGHDNKERTAVGSRKDAMYRKRQSFYLDKNELGESLIHEGRVVQARVVAASEKLIRVEVFGVECVIVARGLSQSWLGDATEKYSVGDRILVRVLEIRGNTVEDLAITADVRSINHADGQDVLKKVVPQGRYAGRVTDVRGGVVYVRLNNGVNAIAHSCYDRRTPGKRDDVSFSVTRLDQEQGVAVGIITRIIKQNL